MRCCVNPFGKGIFCNSTTNCSTPRSRIFRTASSRSFSHVMREPFTECRMQPAVIPARWLALCGSTEVMTSAGGSEILPYSNPSGSKGTERHIVKACIWPMRMLFIRFALGAVGLATWGCTTRGDWGCIGICCGNMDMGGALGLWKEASPPGCCGCTWICAGCWGVGMG